ncbi:MAG: hypothetical protein KGZ67_15560 [Hydrogenophaga sp.]|jgi:hypothetical protein|nr:hypothetical protein [Hydrogenophaga sp.]
MFKQLATMAILFFAQAAYAEWIFVNKVDEFTDKQVRYAAYSDAEHRVQLSYEGKAVWVFISRKKIGTIEPNGLIEIRVDKNKPRVIDPVKSKQLEKLLGQSTFQWEPATVGFLLWHGAEEEGCGYIGELLQGQELKVRYQISSLERDTFSASLVGAKQIIVNGLGLTKCGQ